MSLLHDFATRRDHPLRKSGAQVLEIDGKQVGGVVQSAVVLDEKLVIIQSEGDVTLKINKDLTVKSMQSSEVIDAENFYCMESYTKCKTPATMLHTVCVSCDENPSVDMAVQTVL